MLTLGRQLYNIIFMQKAAKRSIKVAKRYYSFITSVLFLFQILTLKNDKKVPGPYEHSVLKERIQVNLSPLERSPHSRT